MIYTISERYLNHFIQLNESFFEKETNEINIYIDSVLEAATVQKKFNFGEFLKNLFKKIGNVLKNFAQWLFKDYIELFKAAKNDVAYGIFLKKEQEYPMYDNLLTPDILNAGLANNFYNFFIKQLSIADRNRYKDKDFFADYIQNMETEFWTIVSKQFKTNIECSEDFNKYIKTVTQARFVTCSGKEFEKMAISKCSYAPDVDRLISEFSGYSSVIDTKYKDILNSTSKDIPSEVIRGIIKYYRDFADIIIKLTQSVYNCMIDVYKLYKYAAAGNEMKWEHESSIVYPNDSDVSIYKSIFDNIILV